MGAQCRPLCCRETEAGNGASVAVEQLSHREQFRAPKEPSVVLTSPAAAEAPRADAEEQEPLRNEPEQSEPMPSEEEVANVTSQTSNPLRDRWIGRFESDDDVSLRQAPEELRGDKQLVLAAVRANGLDLEFASPILQDDRLVVMSAVRQNRRALDHASKRLRANPEILRALPLRANSTFELLLDPAKRSKLSCAFCCVTEREWRMDTLTDVKNGAPLSATPQRFRDDRQIVMAAVRQDPSSLQHASEVVRDDEVFVLQCIHNQCKVLEFASDRLRYDPDMVAAEEKAYWLDALRRGGPGNWLSDAPDHLRDDEDAVLAAAQRSCHLNFEYVSPRLLDDKDFILRVIDNTSSPGFALMYASDRLCCDKKVLERAMMRSRREHLPDVLKCVPCRDEEWVQELYRQAKGAIRSWESEAQSM